MPSFLQKAGGFQRQRLWRAFKGSALNDILLQKNAAERYFYKTFVHFDYCLIDLLIYSFKDILTYIIYLF